MVGFKEAGGSCQKAHDGCQDACGGVTVGSLLFVRSIMVGWQDFGGGHGSWLLL